MQPHNPAAPDGGRTTPHPITLIRRGPVRSDSPRPPWPQTRWPATSSRGGLILERAIGGWRNGGQRPAHRCVHHRVHRRRRDLAPALIAAVVTGRFCCLPAHQAPTPATGADRISWARRRGWLLGLTVRRRTSSPRVDHDVVYGSAFIVSILVGWPLLGVAMGYLTGDGTSCAPTSTGAHVCRRFMVWVGVFFGRLIVQVPCTWPRPSRSLGLLE